MTSDVYVVRDRDDPHDEPEAEAGAIGDTVVLRLSRRGHGRHRRRRVTGQFGILAARRIAANLVLAADAAERYRAECDCDSEGRKP